MALRMGGLARRRSTSRSIAQRRSTAQRGARSGIHATISLRGAGPAWHINHARAHDGARERNAVVRGEPRQPRIEADDAPAAPRHELVATAPERGHMFDLI
jgi:hypothetical protein